MEDDFDFENEYADDFEAMREMEMEMEGRPNYWQLFCFVTLSLFYFCKCAQYNLFCNTIMTIIGYVIIYIDLFNIYQ